MEQSSENFYGDAEFGTRLLISREADQSELDDNIRAARSILRSFADVEIIINPHRIEFMHRNPEYTIDRMQGDRKGIEGEQGEISIRGPQVMKGYWNRPDETDKVMVNGFFRTGDIGVMDSRGYVKIVDRKKDMILVSGFNVYPSEIEEVLATHPKVLEVAAIGVPDEKSGEVPKLFVVKKDPSLTTEEVLAFAKENLTGYKRPRYVEFMDELPKSNVGKILRKDLRKSA